MTDAGGPWQQGWEVPAPTTAPHPAMPRLVLDQMQINCWVDAMSTLFLTLSGNFWIRLLRRICKAFVPGFLSGSIQPHACCWPARALASAFPMSGMVEHRSQHGRLRLPQLEHKTRRGCAYRPDREKSQYRDGMGVWGISPEARAARNKPPSSASCGGLCVPPPVLLTLKFIFTAHRKGAN